jgi:hypothetical protein
MIAELVERQFAGTRYLARLLELCGSERVVSVEGGFAVFGEVAGASGVVKLHALLGEDGGALRAANSEFGMAVAGARLVVCEIPDDDIFKAAADALLEGGFVEESRADGLVAEGIALRFLVRRPATPAG